jgi:hypothetical protein
MLRTTQAIQGQIAKVMQLAMDHLFIALRKSRTVTSMKAAIGLQV